jgi:hypothetical protein
VILNIPSDLTNFNFLVRLFERAYRFLAKDPSYQLAIGADNPESCGHLRFTINWRTREPVRHARRLRSS